MYQYLAVCIFSVNYGLNLPPFNLLLWTGLQLHTAAEA